MGFVFLDQNIIYIFWKLKMIRGHVIDVGISLCKRGGKRGSCHV